MPTAEASARGLAHKESGTAFERYSIEKYAKDNAGKRIVFQGEDIPPALLSHLRGTPITEEGLREAVKWSANKETERLKNRHSRHFGIDGSSIDHKKSLNGYTVGTMDSEILESKITDAVDSHTVGPNIGVMFRALTAYGNDSSSMPKLRVLAPHEPTKAVMKWIFEFQPHLIKYTKIDVPPEIAAMRDCDYGTVTLHINPPPEIDTINDEDAKALAIANFALRPWQIMTTAATIRVFKPMRKDEAKHTNVRMELICGVGKTVGGFDILKEAYWANIKVFVVHEAKMGKQVAEDVEQMGITAIDLTCCRVKKHEPTSVIEEAKEEEDEDFGVREYASDDDSDEESEDESEEDEQTPVEEEVVLPRAQSAHIIEEFERFIANATDEKPVFLILCHQTLRVLTSTVGKMPGDDRPRRGCVVSQWIENIVPQLENKGHKMVLIIDEWHKLWRARDLFDAILARPKQCQVVLMTGTEPKHKDYRRKDALGTENAAIIKAAPLVGSMTYTEGVKHKHLVPLHVENVYAIDSVTQEFVAEEKYKPTLAQKAETAAAWIFHRHLRTTVVYCGRQRVKKGADRDLNACKVADEFAVLLKDELERLSGRKAWCKPVHSQKPCTAAENSKTLEEFKKRKTADDGDDYPQYRVIMAVGMLKEGYNFPALQACILLHVPSGDANLFQEMLRTARVHELKPMGRALLMGTDSDGARAASLLRKYDPKAEYIAHGAAPSRAKDFVDLATGNAKACKKQTEAIAEREKRVQGQIELLAAHPEAIMNAKIKGYDEAFPESRPQKGDKTMIKWTFGGQARREFNGYTFWSSVRGAWFRNDSSYSTSPAQKRAFLALGPERFGTEPVFVASLKALVEGHFSAIAETIVKKADTLTPWPVRNGKEGNIDPGTAWFLTLIRGDYQLDKDWYPVAKRVVETSVLCAPVAEGAEDVHVFGRTVLLALMDHCRDFQAKETYVSADRSSYFSKSRNEWTFTLEALKTAEDNRLLQTLTGVKLRKLKARIRMRTMTRLKQKRKREELAAQEAGAADPE